MQKNVIETDLTGKVAVVTGAGGVLCGYLSTVLARAGAKVALVNRSDAAILQYAQQINEEGGIARAYKGNVLSHEDMERRSRDLFEEIGSNVPNPQAPVGTRSGGQRQAVAIAKSLLLPGKVMIQIDRI